MGRVEGQNITKASSFYLKKQLIGQVGRVFTNGPGDWGSIPGRVIPKTLKKKKKNGT